TTSSRSRSRATGSPVSPTTSRVCSRNASTVASRFTPTSSTSDVRRDGITRTPHAMRFNPRARSLDTLQDYPPSEFRYLLDLACDLKRAKCARTEQQHLRGKEICLILDKTSIRTRCAFEVACH